MSGPGPWPAVAGRFLVGLLVAVTLALVAGTANHLSRIRVPSGLRVPGGSALSPSAVAPDFRLATVGGDTLSLASLRGRVVLVDFWATWCGPCQAEMPALERLYVHWADRGLEIVAVSVDRQPQAVPEFVRRHGITYPVLLVGQATQARYRVSAVPTLFVVDRQGVIRHRHVGYAPGTEAALAAEVEALLGEG